MRILYSFLFYLFSPLLLVRLYWKSLKSVDYRKRIKERFSLLGKPHRVDIWLHAVSLGEVIAATPLIEAFLSENKIVLVTTMTPTGSAQVVRIFGNTVVHQYLPFDLPWVIQRFITKYQMKIAVIMETEIWPNIIHYMNENNIPLYIINARISDHAYTQYKKVKFLFKPILNKVSVILAQSQLDAQRFLYLGMEENKIKVCGNLKFDAPSPAPLETSLSELKKSWGDRAVLILASTHAGEELIFLNQLSYLLKQIPNLLLLIAPRHPERFDEVYKLGMDLGYHIQRRTQHDPSLPIDILLIDSLGELMQFYQMSDYAFVGGSLVPVGGHNVIEPLVLGLPVFTGPHTHNSRTIIQQLYNAQAIIIIETIDEFTKELFQLHENPKAKEKLIHQAREILDINKGAVQRILNELFMRSSR
jgi:3-deoxy-D-manno-octulosonic-acid transferase